MTQPAGVLTLAAMVATATAAGLVPEQSAPSVAVNNVANVASMVVWDKLSMTPGIQLVMVWDTDVDLCPL